MNNEAVIVFLILCIVLLIGAVIGQKAVLQARINRVLSRMAGELKEILDEERDSALMVFTDNQELMALAGQINRLLEAAESQGGFFALRNIFEKNAVQYFP